MSHRLTLPSLPVETDKVLYDVSRLVRSIGRPFATGIDRIDLAIALEMAARFGERCSFVHAALGGAAILPRETARAVLAHLDAAWHDGQVSAPPALRLSVLGGRVADALKMHAIDAASTTYVVASHTGLLRRPGTIDRLDPQGQMRRLVYLHDLIPLEYPEYQTPDSVDKFRTFLAGVLTGPVRIVTNTEDTARRVRAHAQGIGARIGDPVVCRPALATPPGTRAEAMDDRLRALFDQARPVFVMLGTIEPRKNHVLILEIWRDLASTGTPPHLLVLGKRGWMCEAPAALLDGCARLAPHVTEIGDLNDAGVAAVLARARALLFPSFAEGLGLPVLEAKAAGLPVIASNLPAIREIAPAGAVLLAPDDRAGWTAAIRAAAG